MSTSQFLGARQIGVFNRIGDIYCPANAPFPAFSELGAIEHIDLVITDLPDQDRNDLGLLLTVLSFMPTFVLTFLVATLERATRWPAFIAMPFLLVRFGLRGIIFSLYYSGLKGAAYGGAVPTDIVGYQPTMIRGDATSQATLDA
ncbi:MAG: hypothetical protein AABZ31_00605 [Bdellovibrionota bacterium]